MSEQTGIAWTDATWNPVAGCTRVSAGCDYCYAATLAAGKLRETPAYRGLATVTPSGVAAFNGTIRLLPERLDEPLHWRAPRRVFVNSMSDLFHPGVPDEFIGRVFDVMAQTPRHTYQILTKRPGRVARALGPRGCGFYAIEGPVPCPQPNVWIGVSAEDQERWDERVELLAQVPAAVRFVSAEPLIGPIDCGNAFGPAPEDSPYRPVDWVIVGGESGTHRRSMELWWLEHLVNQCTLSGVPVFVKQDGGFWPGQQGKIPAALWAYKQFPSARIAAL